MVYRHQDIQVFDKQIKELLDKGLIRNTRSPHTSLAFIIRNHVEEKREKSRIVINYKKLNDNIVFGGYYIPNKTTLLNRIQGTSWFSKMDCKKQLLVDKNEREKYSFNYI